MFGEKKAERARVFIKVDGDTLEKIDDAVEHEGWTKSGIVEEVVKKCIQILNRKE